MCWQGAAIAEAYAKEHANLVLVARSEDELKEVSVPAACSVGIQTVQVAEYRASVYAVAWRASVDYDAPKHLSTAASQSLIVRQLVAASHTQC